LIMREPSYHLEGIIRSKDEMEDFTGPLDLILMLLSKNKIEIKDLQISLLLDQYLDHLNMMKEMDLEIASEFVQMASHLTYIKTRMLLTEEKEVTELQVLVSALEQLKNKEAIAAVRENVSAIGKMSEIGLKMHSRGPLPRQGVKYEYRHTPPELLRAIAQILMRGNAEEHDRELESIRKAAPKPIVYSVRDKSRQLLDLLEENAFMSLEELFAVCRSRSELVATFLSVLELCSGGAIFVTGTYGEYQLSRTGQGE